MISKTEILALKSLDGIGDSTIRKIINSDLSIEEISSFNQEMLKKLFIKDQAINSFKNNIKLKIESAELELENYSDNNIEVIAYGENKYPKLLSTIKDYPVLLYCIGNTNLLRNDKNVAIIGTRENSNAGETIADITAQYFASIGYTIVSGLAKGIDSIGHKGALKVKGSTIAVLVDISKIYPKENEVLAQRIIDNNGLLISENKPGSQQFKTAFVLRDRIQSGLSLGIFPIETDIKGGTMHTVEFSQKQNRLLFVPNVFDEKISKWYTDNCGRGFTKINGIKYLIEKKIASPYTSSSFEKVKSLLEDKLNQFVSAGNNLTILDDIKSNSDEKLELNEQAQETQTIESSLNTKEEEKKIDAENSELSDEKLELNEQAQEIQIFESSLNTKEEEKKKDAENSGLSEEKLDTNELVQENQIIESFINTEDEINIVETKNPELSKEKLDTKELAQENQIIIDFIIQKSYELSRITSDQKNIDPYLFFKKIIEIGKVLNKKLKPQDNKLPTPKRRSSSKKLKA